MRTARADFKMTASRVGRLIGLVITIGFFTVLATLAFIIPGIYVAVMWSLATVILLLENVDAGEARKLSWELVGRHFWRTFLLFVLVLLINTVAILGAQMAIEFGLAYLVQLHLLALVEQQVTDLASALTFPITCYTAAAGWLVNILWYMALRAMEQPADQPIGAELVAEPS